MQVRAFVCFICRITFFCAAFLKHTGSTMRCIARGKTFLWHAQTNQGMCDITKSCFNYFLTHYEWVKAESRSRCASMKIFPKWLRRVIDGYRPHPQNPESFPWAKPTQCQHSHCNGRSTQGSLACFVYSVDLLDFFAEWFVASHSCLKVDAWD